VTAPVRPAAGFSEPPAGGSIRTALVVDRESPDAMRAAGRLRERNAFVPLGEADVGVVLGGDGFMLRTLHGLLSDDRDLPVYGLNLGTVGFLLNRFDVENLEERIAAAQLAVLHPLRVRSAHPDGSRMTHLAVNEVSLLRASAQSARLRVEVDGTTQIAELYGDGVLVATAAGSTAYNRSAGRSCRCPPGSSR
jgi:NAD+ kinase